MAKNKDEYGLIKVVQKLELFRALTREEALHVLGMCSRRVFEAEDVVWRPGDEGIDMQVLITGKLHVLDDDEKVIGQVLPGSSFGEMACLTGNQRFVGFKAVEESTALSLTRQSMHGLIGKHPKLYVKILETTIELLAHRVRRASAGAVKLTEEGQPSLW
ncbi:MAG: cyclic nucleotide-binding domain-containing protein [Gemmatimonadetes bacterium]|jgi:CRP-like cAMP-binding protein|nr:cyclic nucleotide-binding domain-containing protein [Gemmatimonadota bacterium]MBT4613338.1 cyclic nucleotide-binding domain-containing protein [Gemmatimonadota bacterium]MBT5058984.1 cyclic nucleotide-binding domain-containing protein [Gemmatimonadota bacterium]MBT5142890.1 cyclic nucleotide-binding domain-containing protein [Gemmatimonadota bacterium]MBT5589484.1 cyclic nucleotide-binding domain-containing protein [Gemmatimonadota bacterium]